MDGALQFAELPPLDGVAGLYARALTRKRLPQWASISGMNGSRSSFPVESSVARISSSLRTSTTSPTRREDARTETGSVVLGEVVNPIATA